MSSARDTVTSVPRWGPGGAGIRPCSLADHGDGEGGGRISGDGCTDTRSNIRGGDGGMSILQARLNLHSLVWDQIIFSSLIGQGLWGPACQSSFFLKPWWSGKFCRYWSITYLEVVSLTFQIPNVWTFFLKHFSGDIQSFLCILYPLISIFLYINKTWEWFLCILEIRPSRVFHTWTISLPSELQKLVLVISVVPSSFDISQECQCRSEWSLHIL